MRRLLPLLVATALVAGCSNRERLNPLDPANAVTHGAPQGFVALAGDASVRLDWQRPPDNLALGYRLFRRVGNASTYDSLTDLSPAATQYLDVGVANGVDYAYRIAYLLADGALSATATDVATPGRARPWVVDYDARTLSRLTPDGRHVAEIIGNAFQTPAAVDVDALTSQVWVCDPYGGNLWRVSPGLATDRIGSFTQPVAVAVDPLNRRVWVCDQGASEVQSLDLASPGTPRVFAVPGLATPLSVAVDPSDGSAWVCERTGDHVRHIGFNGSALGSATASEPSRVAVDSTNGRIWVTSFNSRRVIVFNGAGVAIDTIGGFIGPVGVTVEPRTGHAWVADTGGDRVIAFDRNRVELFRVTGLPAPVEVAVDRASGEAWVALSGAGQVARIAPDGTVLRRLGGFQQPYDVAVEQR